MKKLSMFLAVLVYSVLIQAQVVVKPSILFVGDEDLGFGNKDAVRASLDRLGFAYKYFNANDSSRTPTLNEMKSFPIVIWYCSYDGAGNWFWNGNQTDNESVIGYLKNGGNLWVSGTDLLFDRFGGPVDNFGATDFMNEYLGIASYDVQSKVDDFGDGVPAIIQNPDFRIASVDTITWIYNTSWYVDGVTPVATAKSVYKMGYSDYSLAGKTIAVYYETNKFKAFSSFFDLYEIGTNSMRDSLIKSVINLFKTNVSVSDPEYREKSFKLIGNYPNPFNPETRIEFEMKQSGSVNLKVYNSLGQQITELLNGTVQAGMNSVKWNGRDQSGKVVPSGIYFYRLEGKSFSQTRSMQLIK